MGGIIPVLNFKTLCDIARELRKLSYKELALGIGVSIEALNKYRSGERIPTKTAEKIYNDWFTVPDNNGQLELSRFIKILDEKNCYPALHGLDKYREKAYSKGDYKDFVIGCIEIALDNSQKTPNVSPNTSIGKEDQFSYISKISPFIHSYLRIYLDYENNGFDDLSDKYSDIFTLISRLKHNNEILNTDKLLNSLFKILISEGSRSSFILKVIGPTGSGKSTIIQLLFIKLLRYINDNKKTGILPFMINLVYFENLKYGPEKTFEEHVINHIHDIIDDYKNQCNQNPEMRRIIFISGIHNYKWSVPSIDYILQTELSSLDNLQYIVSVNTDLIINKERIRKDIPLAPMKFSYVLNVESVDLSEEEKATRYLSCYEKINTENTQQLYTMLLKMQFNTIDIYQLKLLKDTIYDRFDDPSFNISDLYESYCLEFFHDNEKLMEDTTQVAFEFAYTERAFTDKDDYTQPYWKLVRCHSSFIDFFISRYFIKKLREYDNSSSLKDFEMILPKTVTSFIKPQLNGSFTDEQRIINLCENKYDSMEKRGKSAMIYWLGRISSPNLTDKACELLLKYYREMNEQLKINEKNIDYPLQEMINDLFVLRGITVSLIYKQDPKISDQYIHSMLENDLISSINRGFHLEYYGDKEYLPVHDTLNYKDVLEVGDKTLRQLIRVNETDLKQNKYSFSFELKLFTICSILQARIENPEIQISFDINPFVHKTISMIKKYLKTGHCKDEKVAFYFKSVLSDFNEYNDNSPKKHQFMSICLYNTFSKANHVNRTGWVKHNIPNPENIIEHTYNCWLMGLLLLPDKIEHEKSYSKHKILEMILIHDIGERITGDIEKSEKIKKPSLAEEEDEIMKMLFLKGTYPSMPNLSDQYSLWTEWHDQNTFNARVAKDIDVIQAIYQLCSYLKEYPSNFTEKTIKNWFKGYNELKTNIGKIIFKNLIEFNNEFNYIDFKEYLCPFDPPNKIIS
jgi:5'-deoxynucleotidase YfbR-like HD superfamily hydrolase/transcriptional regulator with XRE-family HTH domain/energy-coupling factor transporter ATP-binding protein EcfA2